MQPMKYLHNTGLWTPLQKKLLIVGTVPQVSTYLLSGEVDVGFINLTEAMALGIESQQTHSRR